MIYENPKRPVRRNRLITVAKVDEVPENIGAIVDLEDASELALFHCAGEFYAVENFCPHRGASLADGLLDEANKIVRCALHAWAFDLTTGACLTEPSCGLETYQVTIENNEIKIRV